MLVQAQASRRRGKRRWGVTKMDVRDNGNLITEGKTKQRANTKDTDDKLG